MIVSIVVVRNVVISVRHALFCNSKDSHEPGTHVVCRFHASPFLKEGKPVVSQSVHSVLFFVGCNPGNVIHIVVIRRRVIGIGAIGWTVVFRRSRERGRIRISSRYLDRGMASVLRWPGRVRLHSRRGSSKRCQRSVWYIRGSSSRRQRLLALAR